MNTFWNNSGIMWLAQLTVKKLVCSHSLCNNSSLSFFFSLVGGPTLFLHSSHSSVLAIPHNFLSFSDQVLLLECLLSGAILQSLIAISFIDFLPKYCGLVIFKENQCWIRLLSCHVMHTLSSQTASCAVLAFALLLIGASSCSPNAMTNYLILLLVDVVLIVLMLGHSMSVLCVGQYHCSASST